MKSPVLLVLTMIFPLELIYDLIDIYFLFVYVQYGGPVSSTVL